MFFRSYRQNISEEEKYVQYSLNLGLMIYRCDAFKMKNTVREKLSIKSLSVKINKERKLFLKIQYQRIIVYLLCQVLQ